MAKELRNLLGIGDEDQHLHGETKAGAASGFHLVHLGDRLHLRSPTLVREERRIGVLYVGLLLRTLGIGVLLLPALLRVGAHVGLTGPRASSA